GAINDLIVLNYNLQNGELMYDRILLYKDNEQNPVVLMLSDAEDSLTGIYDAANSYNNINQIGHAYVVSNPRSGNDSDVLGAGKYRAVLSDAYGAETEPTYFEVLENPVSFIPSDSYVEVKFANQIISCSLGLLDQNDGDPMFSAKKVLHLTFSEIEHKTIKIDRKDLEAYPMGYWYLRLLTIGEYGVSQVIQKLVPEEVSEEE
ncbi:MAG: hypothetical protein IIV14_04630, partial [Bacteroidaceae bacterium]|nr:hypothetical protein [Bacteroidaceae bacterium]